MANIKSAKKRAKQAKVRTFRNRIIKNNIKTAIKRFEAELRSGNIENAKEAYRIVTKLLDKAAKKGTIHLNTASRKKSRLAQKLNKAMGM